MSLVAVAPVPAAIAAPAPVAATPITVDPPSDPGAGGQYFLDQIGAPDAWRMIAGKPTAATTLAYIDTNVELTNPDLVGRLVPGFDFRFNRPYNAAVLIGNSLHGTLGASAAVGVGGNGVYGAGVVGATPGISLMPLRVVDDEDFCPVGTGIRQDLATDPFAPAGSPKLPRTDVLLEATGRALDFAVAHGAKVVNMSLGTWVSVADNTAKIDKFRQRLRNARDHGVLVVTASGNEGLDETRVQRAGVVVAAPSDPMLPARPDGCPSGAAGGGGFFVYGDALTTEQRHLLDTGTPETVTGPDAKGNPTTWQRTYTWLQKPGARYFPGAFAEEPEFDNIVTVAGTAKTAAVRRFAPPCAAPIVAAPNAVCGGANYGRFADVAAPAEAVPMFSQIAFGYALALDGTSFAAPQVAGAATLLRSLRPDLTPAQTKAAIVAGTDKSAMVSGTFGPDDLFRVPRMLDAAGVAADPRGPRVGPERLAKPVRDPVTRTYTFTDAATSPGAPDRVLTRELTVRDADGNVTRAVTTGNDDAARALTVPVPMNGNATATLTVRDNAGNVRNFAPVTYPLAGTRRDIVGLRLDGLRAFGLDGDIVDGNLRAATGTLQQRLLNGEATMRDASGHLIRVAVNFTSDLFGLFAQGGITLTDTTTGAVTTVVAPLALMSHDPVSDVMRVDAFAYGGGFFGLHLQVRDTDD